MPNDQSPGSTVTGVRLWVADPHGDRTAILMTQTTVQSLAPPLVDKAFWRAIFSGI